MSSSISNSRRSAGLPAITAAAVGAIALYAALIQTFPPSIHAGQDQEATNAIAVEHFLYDGPVPDAVIVGSSQAQRIPPEALGPRVDNLALASQTSLVGLDIVARSGRIPRRVYFEINNIRYPPELSLAGAALAEPRYTLKRWVKALRRTYQPVNVALALLRRAARGRDDLYFPKITDPVLHADLVARQRADLAPLPDGDVLRRNFAMLTRLAGRITEGGGDIVFFEMPMEPSLESVPGVIAVREAMHAAFPPETTCWNDAAAPAGLPSTDGDHLDTETAARFGAELAKTVCRSSPLVAAHPPY